ncbi:hypothetical protein STRIP9103_06084 [Streptomyces ipomoeae 91-03]|uniref:Uncharacterized protein n=1 Tax=Streptomyces ipomoeae 91-03 TaxID=698759 RepID=L1L5E9_9ACTN|nr:hypothetical protein STRIP9103_06084 [Streptomyces ipomoeae 91-03]
MRAAADGSGRDRRRSSGACRSGGVCAGRGMVRGRWRCRGGGEGVCCEDAAPCN